MDTIQPLLLLLGCEELEEALNEQGMQTSTVSDLQQLLKPLRDFDARGIVIGGSTLETLDTAKDIPPMREQWPMVDVILWSPSASGTLVRKALSAGAKDVVLTDDVALCVREIVAIIEAQQLLPRAARLREQTSRKQFEGMYARSQRMWDLFDTATQIAPTDATVLILGETGTGKELMARAIHKHSSRAGRFVPINCGAVSETLVDSELFGHVKGAFTGATADKPGLFRHADQGTLFLDEIGNIPLSAQYRLLRALQENSVRPVGGHTELPVDVRVIAATSDALEERVATGQFREDLFYRIDVIRLDLPPLRARPKDIIYLFAHFARKIAEDYNVERPSVRGDFLDALVAYDWPGNVRQLENFTERLVLTSGKRITARTFERLLPSRRLIAADELPPASSRESLSPTLDADVDQTLEEYLEPRIEEVEREYLHACLTATRGRMSDAAERAGVSRRTLLRKLKKHELDKKDFRS